MIPVAAPPSPGPDPVRGAGPDRVTRLVRHHVPRLLLGALLVSILRLASRPLDNPDTYFHLRFGEEFLTSWSLSAPGSVTSYATASWLPTQWLPQVTMARAEEWAGLPGVAWLSGLQMLGLVLAFYLVARRWADPLPAVVVVIGAVIACGPSLSMRPQVLSFTFVAIVTHLWLRAPRSVRPPWAVVPLTWLWAMTHGMWPLSILIGVVAAVAWSFDDRAPLRHLLRRLAVPGAAGAAAALTPLGPGVYAAVGSVGSRSGYFAEWQSPDVTAPNYVALATMLALTVGIIMRRGGSSWLTTGLVLLLSGFAVYSLRTVPVAAAMLVPLMSRELQRLLGSRSRPTSTELTVVGSMMATSLIILAAVVPHTAAGPPGQPAWVDRELAALPDRTGVLNEWGWGGYLMWRFPHLDLVMHGYGDTFTTAELQRNRDISMLAPGWEDLVAELDVSYAMLDPESPLAYALVEHEGWRVVQASTSVELLQAPPQWR